MTTKGRQSFEFLVFGFQLGHPLEADFGQRSEPQIRWCAKFPIEVVNLYHWSLEHI